MIKVFTAGVLLFSTVSFSQTTDDDAQENELPYKSWSIEVAAGQNKAVRPFSENYYSANGEKYFNFSGVNHFDVGIRKMFSERFGLKFDVGYDRFTDLNNSGSLSFDSKSYRIGLQGVINLSRVLNFETFTKRFGLLAHGGLQVSQFYVTNSESSREIDEDNGGFMIGITPQIKLGNSFSITGDFTAISNVRQHLNWDGNYSDKSNNLTGLFYHASIGLTYYMGKKDIHADWYVADAAAAEPKTDEEARKRLDAIETLMNDTDKDGVPDYLDSENNTPAGLSVDTRGKFIDSNRNGVPDELERKANNTNQNFENNDSIYNRTNTTNNQYAASVLQSLVENGNVNIFYDVNMVTPNSGSSNSVQQLYQYLIQFPTSKIKLVGFADVRGSEGKNQNLSQRRAQKLKDFFVSSGISSDRITIGGQGVDKTFPAETKTGLDLARRVSVELIK